MFVACGRPSNIVLKLLVPPPLFGDKSEFFSKKKTSNNRLFAKQFKKQLKNANVQTRSAAQTSNPAVTVSRNECKHASAKICAQNAGPKLM